MRIVFLGTSEFAVPTLHALLDSRHEIASVFTQPDRPAGRGQRLQPPPIKQLALSAGLTVHQPERIRTDENLPLFQQLAPDFLVVAAYGQILPGWLLRSARVAPVNVHASLLPKYRGAAPIAWALLNGERETGVTTMLMEEQLDTGPILLRERIEVSDTASAGELTERLALLGASLILPTLDGFASGRIRPEPQDAGQAGYAPRLDKAMAQVLWRSEAARIHNQVRAFNPWPLAYSDFKGQRVQILRTRAESEPVQAPLPPGSYLGREGNAIRVQCGQGTVLQVLDLKLAGRQPVSGAEFASGFRLIPGMHAFPEDPGLGG